MEKVIKLFTGADGIKLRGMLINNEPWFVGKDVADALGYTNPSKAVRDHVDEEDKGVNEMDTPGGIQQIVFINESGLYSLILQSKLESAKRFKRWVTKEVLPALRKNGHYSIGKKQDSYCIIDPVERAKRWIEEQEEMKMLECQNKEMKPKADYFDALVDSRLLTTFRDCAKEFDIKPRMFTKWLIDNGFIYHDRKNMIKPYSQYVSEGLFRMKDFQNPNGYSSVQTFITVKGKESFRLMLGLV